MESYLEDIEDETGLAAFAQLGNIFLACPCRPKRGEQSPQVEYV